MWWGGERWNSLWQGPDHWCGTWAAIGVRRIGAGEMPPAFLCVSGARRSGLDFPAVSLTAHFPTSVLWPPSCPGNRVRMGTKVFPCLSEIQKCIFRGSQGDQSPQTETEERDRISDYREHSSGFTQFLRHWGILVSWNPDFAYLGVCRKASAQETKGIITPHQISSSFGTGLEFW